MKNVAIYLRVSTTDQTTDNQRRELEAVASRHNWTVVRVFEDSGISGAKGRDARPGLDALMKGVSRRDFDMVLAWSVDRLEGPPDSAKAEGHCRAHGGLRCLVQAGR
jgi:DNA invertase Pin-like site-specific DNA recombinase